MSIPVDELLVRVARLLHIPQLLQLGCLLVLREHLREREFEVFLLQAQRTMTPKGLFITHKEDDRELLLALFP